VEIALDVEAVSAACPTCKILLVEADDPSFEGLGEAENTAVRLGAKVVSNSYGATSSTA
jgi:subtilase family serine protease